MIYEGEKLKKISFPLGGIGTGCIGLSGNGSLTDFEIFNRPNKGGRVGYTFFALRAEFPGGRTVTKVLQGDHCGDLTGYEGTGADRKTMCGFPHFQSVTFDGSFPIARLTFRDGCIWTGSCCAPSTAAKNLKTTCTVWKFPL